MAKIRIHDKNGIERTRVERKILKNPYTRQSVVKYRREFYPVKGKKGKYYIVVEKPFG